MTHSSLNNDSLSQISSKVKKLNSLEKAKSKQQINDIANTMQYDKVANNALMNKLAFKGLIAQASLNINNNKVNKNFK